MKINMKNWFADVLASPKKKAFPILSFPAVTLLQTDVLSLISDSELQAKGMEEVAKRCDTLASVSLMDLSVEAEAFGSTIKASNDEVPTVVGHIIENMQDAERLAIPEIGSGRTGTYIEAIRKATSVIDRPVFAGAIGPFSLSGRLMDMTEIMVNCYVEPEIVHETLKKATEFIIKYVLAFKDAGANGVVIAEPAAGLLSPALNAEFSVPYMQKIVETVSDDNFSVIYHNCGNTIPLLKDILTIGAAAYHFGDAVDIEEVAKLMPNDTIFMGNVSPANQFRNGTPESIKADTALVIEKCGKYSNFILSSGCDIPPLSSWENIDAFFEVANSMR